jgi:hypothetical protein
LGCTACALVAGFLFVCSAIAENGARAKIDAKEIEIISSRDLIIIVAPY